MAYETSSLKDENLERTLLGVLIMNSKFTPLVDEECFYRETHKWIYRTILKLVQDQASVSLPLISSLLPTIPAFYISKLVEGVPSVREENVLDLVKRLKEYKQKRRIYVLTSEIQQSLVRDDLGRVDEIITKIKKEGLSEADTPAATAEDLMHAYEEYIAKGEGIKSGIPTLDKLLRGVGEGEVLYLLGRKIGKSTFIQNWLRYFVINYPQYGAIFFSLEMPQSQIAERTIQIEKDVSQDDARSMGLLEKEAVAKDYKNIFYITKAAISLSDIQRIIIQLKFRANIKLVIVDFLTRLKTHVQDEEEYLSYATRVIKDMAKELEIAVIIISQVNRGAGEEGGTPLTMQAGRGSGTIEENADFVLGVYRPEENPHLRAEDRGKWKDIMVLQILASRRTATGVNIYLHFDKGSLRIREIEYGQSSN